MGLQTCQVLKIQDWVCKKKWLYVYVCAKDRSCQHQQTAAYESFNLLNHRHLQGCGKPFQHLILEMYSTCIGFCASMYLAIYFTTQIQPSLKQSALVPLQSQISHGNQLNYCVLDSFMFLKVQQRTCANLCMRSALETDKTHACKVIFLLNAHLNGQIHAKLWQNMVLCDYSHYAYLLCKRT